jgi:hypothetical protein
MNQAELEVHGRALLLALYTQNRWLIRTVDKVSFIDRNTVRRRIVRHFTAPTDDGARPVLGGRLILPVFSLRKKSFISCDLRDGGDRRIALRPIEERWNLTFQMVMSLLCLADPTAAKDPSLYTLTEALVRLQNADEACNQLLIYARSLHHRNPRIASLAKTKAFEELVTYVARNYLVFVEVDEEVRGPHIISYVIDQRFPDRRRDFELAGMSHLPRRRFRKMLGLIPHQYYHPLTISGAGSNHLEIRAPDGVEIGRRKLKLPDRVIQSHGTSTRHARFLIPRSVKPGEAYARLDIVPGAGVMRRAGPVVLIFLAILVGFVAAADVKPGPGAALLLILPGLTSLITARPNENPYVSRVVLGVRVMTLAPIPLAAAATGALIAGWCNGWLWLVAGAALFFAAILGIGQHLLRERTNYRELVHNDLTRVA